ncbi:hypothetical protein PHYPSEUDO_010301 [Phytophthora pseudosyringae]|uniref:Uncharacterized protein n=1 Tax=Phytophthora pseudosyringae TaxID=221518 RepID=A0A8T1VAD9_9STRA|nr:hypothetical protein PHYPSEUDO_010301 [Phytophthora pseudosyringae]
MPLGNDSRPSRRPMPRQLDMSGWSMDSSSATQDRGPVRSACRSSREADGFSYRKTREAPDRFDSFRENEYQPRRSSTREESPRPFGGRPTRTSEYEASSFSSGRSTTRDNTFDSAFPSTSIGSSGDFPRVGSSSATSRSDRENRHDNQSEVDDHPIRRDHMRRSYSTHHDSPRRTSEHSDTRDAEASSYAGGAESFTSRTSFGYLRSGSFADSSLYDGKADLIREAESPVAVRLENVKASRNADKGPTRTAPEIETSSLASGFENQDEHPSPTNSETSIPPTSPASECDSVAKRIRDRYPTQSIPSPVSSDRSTVRRRASSPCSSVSTTTRTYASRGSTTRSKTSDSPQRAAQSAMSDLREDLYAFRKQMREVFIRVEDMVDVHRSFFKSEPSTGSPVFREELQQEAEQLANEAFEQLADLRLHFTRLAKDFQRADPPAYERPVPNRERKTRLLVAASPVRAHHAASTHSSDDGNTSVKGSELPEDDGSDRLSVASDNNDEASTMEPSPIIRNLARVDSDDEDAPTAIMPDSKRTTASTYLSSQLQSRWRKNSSVDSASVAMSDISERMRPPRGRSPSIVSDASSLPDQCSKASETDANGIFRDFDKRMEQIRCSLNAIASGKKPRAQCSTNVAAAAASTAGGAGSPIRAMMDATRTGPTLREASRISRRLACDGDANVGDHRRAGGGREAELHQLLQELNDINAGNADDDD